MRNKFDKTVQFVFNPHSTNTTDLTEFTKDGLCDFCQKGKQRKASFKSKSILSNNEPLMFLHMDLFGPVNIMSISKKNMH